MAVRFQLRRDTAANWASANSVLALGEPGVETDTLKVKVGDGSTAWNSLGYSITKDFADLTNTPTTLAAYGITDALSLVQLSVTQNNASGNGALTYNNATGVFDYTPPNFEGLNGNFTGSVFADDSTVMVDGVSGKIVGQLEVSDPFINGTIDSTDSSPITITPEVILSTGLTVGNHIIPSSNENIDLGSSTNRFRELFLSGNTISLDSIQLSSTGTALQIHDGNGTLRNIQSHNINANDITANNITTTGYIAGPAVFTIDPAAVGDNTGKVVIAGDLQVDGTQTTINSTILEVDDKNITLSAGSPNSAGSDGAGITVDNGSDTDAEIKYSGINDAWEFNKDVGIGTDNPGSPLQVESATDYLANFKSSDTTAGVKLTDSQSQGRVLTANGHLVLIADANNAVGSSSIRFSLDTTSIAVIDSGMVLTNTGLGIGIPTPSEALDVSGNIQATGTITGTAFSGITLGGSLAGDYTDAKVQYGTSYSGTPAQGSFFFDSLNAKLKVYNGSSFVDAVPAGAGGGGGGGASDATATFRKYNYDITSTTNSVSGKDSVVVTAGAFVIGYQYEILSVGETDFQDIGASADTVGVTFTATGVGSGTGTAGHILNYVTDGTQNVEVYRNGAKMVEGASDDYVATTGTSVNFTFNLADGDVVDVQVYELLTQDSFYTKTETYTQAQVNTNISTAVADYLPLAGGSLDVGSNTGTKLDLTTTGTSGINFDIIDGNSTARMRNVSGRLHLTADVGDDYADSEIRFLVDNSVKMSISDLGNVKIGGSGASDEAQLELSSNSNVTSVFTGSISGTTLTVTGMASGAVTVGDRISDASIEPNTVITALGTGNGGQGTYTVSISQTAPSQTLRTVTKTRNLLLFKDTDTSMAGGTQLGTIEFESSDSSNEGTKAFITAVTESASAPTSLVFGTATSGQANASSVMTLSSSSRLGVNTAPGVVSADGIHIGTAPNGNCELDLENTAGARYRLQSTSSSKLQIRNTGFTDPVFTVDSNNRIGIGEETPLALLHIHGSGDAIRVTSTNSGAGGAQLDLLHHSSDGVADGDTPGVVNFGGYYTGTTAAYSASIKSKWIDAGARQGSLEFLTRNGNDYSTRVEIDNESKVIIYGDKGDAKFTGLSFVHTDSNFSNGTGLDHEVEMEFKLPASRGGDTTPLVAGTISAKKDNNSDWYTGSGTSTNFNGRLAFSTRQSNVLTEQMTINRIGNVGVGTSTPSFYAASGSTGQKGIHIDNVGNDTSAHLKLTGHNNTGTPGAATDFEIIHQGSSLKTLFRHGPNDLLSFNSTNVINTYDSAYNSSVGHASYTSGAFYITRSANSSGSESFIVNNLNSGGNIGILQYRVNNGVQGQYLVGSNSSGITFAGSSDYRIKDNITTITESSLDKISQLRLVTYTHNELSNMPTDEQQIGVIAHEIEEVFPEMVDGEKDAVWTQEELDERQDESEILTEVAGDPKIQTVSLLNKDMMVHVLKALQELKDENVALKARLDDLEG